MVHLIRNLKILLLLLFTATVEPGVSQSVPPPPPPPPPPPSLQVNKADSLFSQGNIKGAVAEYKKMHDMNPGNLKTTYNYACALSRMGMIDSAFRYLTIAVEGKPTTRPLADPDLLPLREDKRWNDFENKLIISINKNPNTENQIKDAEYAKELLRLLCMDQYCFYETGLAVSKLGFDSPVVTALRRLQNIQNKMNLDGLELLLEKNGWPAKSQVGDEAASAPFYILQHSNAAMQEKYLPMFEKRCRENEADWQQYALMFDRMRINRNLPQRFGTHSNLDNRMSGEAILYPLEDETRVDEWRKEIGLEPLNDYLKRANIKYVPSGVKNK